MQAIPRIEFNKFNPFRQPDWRLTRVLSLADRPLGPGRCARSDDKMIQEYKRFLLRYRKYEQQSRETDMQQLFYENPGMYYAHQVYTQRHSNKRVATLIEARLLAGFSSIEICQQCETMPETIEWYEKLFFNVQDRLHATDWILNHVLTPAIMEPPAAQAPVVMDHMRAHQRVQIGEPFYDATLKYFAYFGGPVMCDFMIHGARRAVRPHNEDELLDYLEEEFKHKLYRRTLSALQTFEINKFNITELFASFAAIMNIRLNSDTQEAQKTAVNRNMQRMLVDMPWMVGDAGLAHFQGTSVADYDASAVELRTPDLMLLAAGNTDESVKHLLSITMPPPSGPRSEEPIAVS